MGNQRRHFARYNHRKEFRYVSGDIWVRIDRSCGGDLIHQWMWVAVVVERCPRSTDASAQRLFSSLFEFITFESIEACQSVSVPKVRGKECHVVSGIKGSCHSGIVKLCVEPLDCRITRRLQGGFVGCYGW